MHSKTKPVTEPMIIENAKYFYDEMKITNKCTSSDVSNEKITHTNL
jgi:hypothetical protein